MRTLTTIAPFGIVFGGYVWGGTSNAHQQCLTHQLGNNSVQATAACVFVH